MGRRDKNKERETAPLPDGLPDGAKRTTEYHVDWLLWTQVLVPLTLLSHDDDDDNVGRLDLMLLLEVLRDWKQPPFLLIQVYPPPSVSLLPARHTDLLDYGYD